MNRKNSKSELIYFEKYNFADSEIWTDSNSHIHFLIQLACFSEKNSSCLSIIFHFFNFPSTFNFHFSPLSALKRNCIKSFIQW